MGSTTMMSKFNPFVFERMMAVLPNFRAHYVKGANRAIDSILREMVWWGQIYGDFYADYPEDARKKVLQVAVALPLTPEMIETCDRISPALVDLIENLSLALSVSDTSAPVTLPDFLI